MAGIGGTGAETGIEVLGIGVRAVVVATEIVAGVTRTGAEVVGWIGAVPGAEESESERDVRVEGVDMVEGVWKTLEVLGIA